MAEERSVGRVGPESGRSSAAAGVSLSRPGGKLVAWVPGYCIYRRERDGKVYYTLFNTVTCRRVPGEYRLLREAKAAARGESG